MNFNNNPNPASPDPVAKAVQDNGNAKLVGAKEVLKEKLLGAVLQQAINELGEPAAIARSIMAGKGDQLGSIAAASRVLRELIVAEIELRSRQNFTDPVGVAKELFRNVSEEGKVVESITSELRAMVLALASQSATDSVADSQSVARELLDSNTVDDTLIAGIGSSLRQLVLDTAATRARESLTDTDSGAHEVLRGMGENPELIVDLGDRVREFILSEVERRANESIADRSASAAQVWQRIGSDNEAIRAVVDKVHDQLIGDIASRSRQALANVEETASIARDLIGPAPEGVVSAGKRLEEMLIAEIVQSGERALADTQNAIRMALEEIKPSADDLARIQEGLKSKILSDVLARAIKEINEEVSQTAADLWLTEAAADSNQPAADRVDRPATSLGESNPTDMEPSAIESGTAQASKADDNAAHVVADLEWNPVSDLEDDMQDEAEDHTEPDEEATAIEQTAFEEELPTPDGVDATEADSGIPEWPSSAFEAPAVDDDTPAETSGSDSFSDDTGWYSLEVTTDGEDGQASNSAEEDAGLKEDEIKAIGNDSPRPEALGLLAGWKRKRRSWKVDEVDLSAPADEPVEHKQEEDDTTMTTGSNATDLGPEYADKESWIVSIVRDAGRLSVKVSESDRMIEDSLSKISQGVMTFVKDEMNRLDGLGGGEAAELMCEHCIQRTHTALSDRTIENKKRSVDASPLPDADVIFVGAYLVEKGNGDILADEVTRLSAEFGDLGFTLVLDGPFAPHEFVKDGPSNMERAIV